MMDAASTRDEQFRRNLLLSEIEHACAEGARNVRRWSLRESGMQPTEAQIAHGSAAALLRCLANNRVSLEEIDGDLAEVCRSLADSFDATNLGRCLSEGTDH